MEKKTKIIVALVALVATAGIAYFLTRKGNTTGSIGSEEAANNEGSAGGSGGTPVPAAKETQNITVDDLGKATNYTPSGQPIASKTATVTIDQQKNASPVGGTAYGSPAPSGAAVLTVAGL